MIDQLEITDLAAHRDDRGALIAIESGQTVPFEVHRVYYMYNTRGEEPRGFHAHRKLWQFAICLRGGCKMLMDDGSNVRTYDLDRPDRGIIIPPMIWHEMHSFEEGSILLVLASDHYDESDYIRDRATFAKELSDI